MIPMSLGFSDLRFTVFVKGDDDGWCRRAPRVEREVLHGITGQVNPGELLAVMGPSGSGKTTFLRAIGRRFTASEGFSTGRTTINGRAMRKKHKRKVGFVMQDDILFPSLTVRESLEYTARLRLPGSMTIQVRRRVAYLPFLRV